MLLRGLSYQIVVIMKVVRKTTPLNAVMWDGGNLSDFVKELGISAFRLDEVGDQLFVETDTTTLRLDRYMVLIRKEDTLLEVLPLDVFQDTYEVIN